LETDRLQALRAESMSSAADETRLVLVLVALLTLGLVDTQVLGPLLPEIARELGTAASAVGRTVSGYAIAAAIAALVIGPRSDRRGRRPFLVGAGFLVALGSAVSATTSSIAGFALGRIVTGAGAGVISALTVAAIADVIPYERRGRSMGWVAIAYTAAPILGVPLAAWVAGSLGWRVNYVAFAASGIFLGLAVRLWLKESAPSPSAGRRARTYLSFFAARSTAAGALSAFFVTGGVTGFLLFLGAYLQSAFGLDVSQVGMVFLLSGVASLVGAFGAGRLSDRAGKLRMARASSLLLALFLLMIPYVEGLSLYALLGLVGLAVAGRLAPLQSLITELGPPDERGAYVALRNTLSQCGNAAGALAAAALYEGGFEYVCYLTAGFSLVAFGLLFGIEEPR
jgi:predicted MFS family arabinose efflux permease